MPGLLREAEPVAVYAPALAPFFKNIPNARVATPEEMGGLDRGKIETTQKTYDGVTHEFFGMGTVVPEAKEAMTLATTALSQALGVK